MQAPLCKLCGSKHYGAEHVFGVEKQHSPSKPDQAKKQRWARKAYNAYQRNYMMLTTGTDRAVKAGRAMWLKRKETA